VFPPLPDRVVEYAVFFLPEGRVAAVVIVSGVVVVLDEAAVVEVDAVDVEVVDDVVLVVAPTATFDRAPQTEPSLFVAATVKSLPTPGT